MNFQTITLTNGLRVVCLPSSSKVVYCGYEVGVGSQDEQSGEEGLAHFCEHVTFKGTKRRTALQVINELESVGGELNAFTTKSDTVFYAAVLVCHLSRAVDLLTDVVFHSVYPQEEIDKEVEVICDEIESYNDSPAELIYDDFENVLFRGTPLGHNILGTASQVRSFRTEDAKRFTSSHYLPASSVFFAYGNVDIGVLASLLSSAFGGVGIRPSSERKPHPASANIVLPPLDPAVNVLDKATHQAHVMLGNRAYSLHHPLRPALVLLNNIVGGPSLNARLNLSLREQRGLVYSVESTLLSYDAIGGWSVYFGCDPADVEQCIDLVKEELCKLVSTPLSEDELSAAKQQMCGQIGIACDNRENFALDFGKSFLHFGYPKDPEMVCKEFDALTADTLQQVAIEVLNPDKLSTLIYR